MKLLKRNVQVHGSAILKSSGASLYKTGSLLLILAVAFVGFGMRSNVRQLKNEDYALYLADRETEEIAEQRLRQ